MGICGIFAIPIGINMGIFFLTASTWKNFPDKFGKFAYMPDPQGS
jgi:hypothetical protein